VYAICYVRNTSYHGRGKDYWAAPSATVKRSLSPGSVTVITLGRPCQRCDARGEILGGGSPNPEEFPGGGSQGHVRTSKVVNRGLGQHGVVLQLRLPQGGAVPGDQHKLGCRLRLISSRDLLSLTLQSPGKEVRKVCCTFAVSHLLQGGLVSERVLSRFDDESETGGDGLGGFGGF